MTEKTDYGSPPPEYLEHQPGSNPPAPGYAVNQGYASYPAINMQTYPPIQTGVVVTPYPSQTTYGVPPPNDHMTMAILSIIFGFWPLGIFAVMRASESRAAYARGDLMAANSASVNARRLSIYSFIIGGISLAAFVILMIVLAVTGVFSYSRYCYGYGCY